MGGSALGTPFIKHLEHDVSEYFGFIALDPLGSGNVVGYAPPSNPVPAAGSYTMMKGLMKAIGPAGSVVTQPYQSPGIYTFTLDEPWMALLDLSCTLQDMSAASPAFAEATQGYLPLAYSVRANVRNNSNGPRYGIDPGTDSGLSFQTFTVYWRATGGDGYGTLASPPPGTGWWMRLVLKRTAVY